MQWCNTRIKIKSWMLLLHMNDISEKNYIPMLIVCGWLENILGNMFSGKVLSVLISLFLDVVFIASIDFLSIVFIYACCLQQPSLLMLRNIPISLTISSPLCVIVHVLFPHCFMAHLSYYFFNYSDFYRTGYVW